MDNKFEVGDILVEDTPFSHGEYKVVRVTKTMAVMQVNDNYQQKYRREYVAIGKDNISPTAIPYIKWNNAFNKYKVIKATTDKK